MLSPVPVTVTGAAGQIGYQILARIASGQMLGPEQPVVLRLLEIESAMKALQGTIMELQDCAFPLLRDVIATTDPRKAFEGCSWALLVGSFPRKKGMERNELIQINAGIFQPQGRALGEVAASDVRILVVGNPCNTNALIAKHYAPEIPDDRWFAMTRLDENRAKEQLALKSGVPVDQITNMTIWGNHSSTMFPDAWHARIVGRPAPDVIKDEDWLKNTFIPEVQQRGAKIIEARGASSAASAANAALDCVNSLRKPSHPSDWTSVAVCSHGEYGVPEGLFFSYPVKTSGASCSIVEWLELDAFAREKIRITTEELLAEREAVKALLGGSV